MGFNKGVITGWSGGLRILTLVFGVVTLGLAAMKHNGKLTGQVFFGMVVLVLLVTLIWTITSLLVIKMPHWAVDILLHLICGVLLLIPSSVWIASVAEKKRELSHYCKLPPVLYKTIYHPRHLAAGIFGLGNGFVCMTLAAMLMLPNRIYQSR